jgi:hypothetical protein
MRALTADWWDHHRSRMACWHHDRLDDVIREMAEMQAEICELQQELAAQHDTTPTAGTITATTKDGTMTDTYAPGQTIYLTAGNFTNTEGAPVTGTVTGTWTADQGTVTQNPNNPDKAQIDGATTLGDINATFTADTGLVLTYQATIADQTPTAGTITGSTTPPADEPAPAA